MTQVATMSVLFAADIAGFSKDVSKAEKTFLASAKSMTSAGEDLSLKLTAPFLAISGVMAKTAADAEASMTRFTRVFGPATSEVQAFAKEMTKTIPVTTAQMDTLLATTQAFVAQLGMTPQAAVGMTEALTKVAGDIAAFRGLNISDVMDTLEHGMAGRTQGLVSLGIAINKAEVQEKAYQMGLTLTGEKLTVAAQSAATLALVEEKTANIHGEAARTANNAANALKFFKAAVDEAAESWGATLLPKLTDGIHTLTELVRSTSDASDAFKTYAFSVGAVAATVGPLLIVSGTLIKSMTEVARLGRLVSGAEGLGALAAGGGIVLAVVAGLGLIGAAFYSLGINARDAQSHIDSYKASLAGLSTVQLGAAVINSGANLQSATAKLNTMKPSTAFLSDDWLVNHGMGALTLGDQSPFMRQQSTVGVLAQQHADALSAYSASLQGALFPGAAMTPGGVGGKDAGGDAKKVMDAFTAQAQTLLTLQPQLETGWTGLDDLGQKQLNTFTLLNSALAAQSDQYSDVAIKLRDLIAKYQQLQVVQLAVGGSMLTPLSFMVTSNPTQQQLGVNSVGNSLQSALPDSAVHALNINTAVLPQLPSKFDQLGDVFTNAIASQAQFIAQSLTTVLGVRNANAGGAIGSVIGGGIGGGVGKLLGAGLGTVLGSAVPVVGTVLGSIAGGFIGNAIGGLFGGAKKATDTATSSLTSLATAANAVTQSLQNAPSGFKVQGYEYAAQTPQVVVTGDVHLYGVTDISDMYDKLSDLATTKSYRGGTQRLSAALSPAI